MIQFSLRYRPSAFLAGLVGPFWGSLWGPESGGAPWWTSLGPLEASLGCSGYSKVALSRCHETFAHRWSSSRHSACPHLRVPGYTRAPGIHGLYRGSGCTLDPVMRSGVYPGHGYNHYTPVQPMSSTQARPRTFSRRRMA